MARKTVPDATQNNILLKSRRRCCLCFWLDGRDEVVKGQIAHLDGENKNAAEDNLTFLCFDHHDDYDGTPRLAKGLREDEVRKWRDELYKEMEYRFRTIKRRGFEFVIHGFVYPELDVVKAVFKLKNTGDGEARSPIVSIRVPDNVTVDLPLRPCGTAFGDIMSWPSVATASPFGVEYDADSMYEARQDFFEPNGRVAVKEIGGPNPVLLQGHSVIFEGLMFDLADYPPGAEFELECRVDAEGMDPIRGKVTATVPENAREIFMLLNRDPESEYEVE